MSAGSPANQPAAEPSETTGLRRRAFLGQLGAAGALATILPRGAKAATAPSAAAPSAAAGRASFVVLGDFGAGNVIDEVPGSTPNPNAKAVAEGVRTALPPEAGGYIMSVGDQVYVPFDGSETEQATDVKFYDQAVGQFYAPYVLFPAGSTSEYAPLGAAQMNFYAMLGDHDWWHQPRQTNPHRATALYYALNDASFPAPTQAHASQTYPPAATVYLPGSIDGTGTSFSGYMQYFANQGAGSDSGHVRHYDFVRDAIHWIVLSSDANETMLAADGGTNPPFMLSNAYYLPVGGRLPGGLTYGEDNLHNSVQGRWFKEAVAATVAGWRFVATHYPPFSSSAAVLPSGENFDGHPSATYMQWGYENFGVDAVFSGHVHGYERLYTNGVTYVVCGAGGTFEPLANYVNPPLPESLGIIAQKYGFLAAEQRAGAILFAYHVVASPDTPGVTAGVQDRFTLLKGGALADADLARQNMVHLTAGGGAFHVASTVTIGAVLVGTGPLTVNGKGQLRVAGLNPKFTGALTVRRSRLRLAASSALNPAVRLTLAGGDLGILARSQSFSTPLVVEGHSSLTVNLRSRLQFASSREARWTKGAKLTIHGEIGRRAIRFGTGRGGLTKTQLKKIRFANHRHATAALDEHGYLRAR